MKKTFFPWAFHVTVAAVFVQLLRPLTCRSHVVSTFSYEGVDRGRGGGGGGPHRGGRTLLDRLEHFDTIGTKVVGDVLLDESARPLNRTDLVPEVAQTPRRRWPCPLQSIENMLADLPNKLKGEDEFSAAALATSIPPRSIR
jgi:hypothetical protein